MASKDDREALCEQCRENLKQLLELLNQKVEKKDSQLHKVLETAIENIQASLDDGKERFRADEEKAELARVATDKKFVDERAWTEGKLEKRDIANALSRRWLAGILIGIGLSVLSSLGTFLFMHGKLVSTVETHAGIIKELHDWKELRVTPAEEIVLKRIGK